MNKSEVVYLGIGGNIEDRLQYINNTQKLIEENIGKITNLSSIYETPPWGFKAEINFLNRVVEVETTLNVHKLLKANKEIENKLNRERSNNGYISRTADVDILFYGNNIINAPELDIPHPRLHMRKFVLLPLAEIAPNFIHPVLKKTIKKLLSECNDESECFLFSD